MVAAVWYRPRMIRASALFALPLAAGLLLAGCAASPPEPQTEPGAAPPASTTAAVSDPVSSSEAAAPSSSAATAEAVPKTDGLTKLDTYGLPLSIKLPEGTPVAERKGASMGFSKSPGGVFIGSSFSDIKIRVFKAGDSEKPIANMKKQRKARNSCDHKLVREEADMLVYQCAKDDHYAILLLDIGGTAYVCESESFAKTPELVEPQIAACRSLKAL